MKRQQERETPPKSKRQRMGYGGPDGSDIDRLSPESDRREGRGSRQSSKNHREMRDRMPDRDRDYDLGPERPLKRHKGDDRMMDDPYMRDDRPPSDLYNPEYRTLCITNVNPQVSDGLVRDALLKAFEKFGEFNIKINRHGDHRMAYLNFRHPEDAKNAKHARGKLILFDRALRIDSVYQAVTHNKPGWPENKRRRSSASPPPRGPPPEYMRDIYPNRGPSPPRSRHSGVRHSSLGRDVPPPREREYHNFDNRRQHNEQAPPRFPHHLQHIPPEDDVNATRTLFVGKLDNVIEEEELRDVFERFGIVEEIDIKRPQNKGPGTAYAFVKFFNLDMAHRAKVEMSGQYIGKFQCKIGYGKATSTTCLWVGGLGPWVRPESLEREFDRFGAIHRIVWPQGKNYAYVLYDSLDAAQAACQEMRGFPLGGPDRKIKMDFADVNHISDPPPSPPLRGRHEPEAAEIFMGPPPGTLDREAGRDRPAFDNQWQNNRGFNGNRRGNGRKDSWGSNDRNNDNSRFDNDRFRKDDVNRVGDNLPDRRKSFNKQQGYNNERTYRSNNNAQPPSDRPNDFPPMQDRNNGPNSRKEHSPGNKKRRSPENREGWQGEGENGGAGGSEQGLLQLASMDHVDNILDLAKCLPVVWSGALVLKNSAFAARMHLLSGDVNLVDTMMRDSATTELPVLRIMQRLRLDQPKLDEVTRRIAGCGPGGHSILLAMPGSAQALEDSNTNIQQRPLRNLMSYLKQKEAAGVITLPPNPSKDGKDNHGVLYAFPPCEFSQKYLEKRAPKLSGDPCKEDHLMVFVVKTDGPLTI